MTPPTPAAVRAAMKHPGVSCTDEEERAFMQEKRYSAGILRDHIRAIAQEMRATIPSGELTMAGLLIRDLLNGFADKLEGKQS